ncbi:MAG: isoprenylcysteine carboxylmethyltransferase family protein [Terracidiphilus sp.]|jgi:protein-S-isoprenylcysteine O-methyltransferase Ste14
MPKLPPEQKKKRKNTSPAKPLPAKMSLGLRLGLGLTLGLIFAFAVLFVTAGTLNYWQGWVFLAVFFVPNAFTFIYFLKRDPEFLERRLRNKERFEEQKLLLRWGKPFYLVAFLLPGCDYRWGWSRTLVGGVPLWLTIFSLAMVFGSLLLIFRVLYVNRFASRIVEVEAGQTVISHGPYRVVRHPYYFATVLLWLFTPLALGSWVALPAFVLLIPFYVIRLLNEEKVLRAQLTGYAEYCQRTRFRLIPLVW